jgi:predicted ATP-binding protein involved in virulence
MRFNKLEFKNFASYGNRTQVIEFDKENSDLYLVLGDNGSGKCLAKETEIYVEIEDVELKTEFIKFIRNKKPLAPK